MIQDIFDVLGCKQEEAKTYLALVESGPRTATELSKLVGAPRPTIYGYLERRRVGFGANLHLRRESHARAVLHD